MKLTSKLLGFLNRVFDKDPKQFLALRLRYPSGTMTWQVADAVLTTTVTGGIGTNLTVDLTQYTIGQLVSYLAAQPGYVVPYADSTELSLRSARVLLDASGDQSQSNGDHLYGYNSILWSYMDAAASELTTAQKQIGEALKQLSTVTASGEWLDEIGGYYGVPRLQGELDNSYGPRIIAEVLRPRGNNIALEAAISAYTGEKTTVTDVVIYTAAVPIYNGVADYNGVYYHNNLTEPRYGLFDVDYGYDLINGADISSFVSTVMGIIERLRDAGTHLRYLQLQGGTITDALTPPTDGPSQIQLSVSIPLTDSLTAPTETSFGMAAAIVPFSDTLASPGDAESLTVTYAYKYAGLRQYNGIIQYVGGSTSTESL